MAAQHFFKVGELRSHAKTMVLSLAQQLAERLPGLAELLKPTIAEHGAAENLSLLDTFEAYLLQPLLALEEKRKEAEGKEGQGQGGPLVVLLIDALDEADDGRGDWRPVAALISKE